MAAVYSLLRLSAAVPAAAVGGMRRFSGKNKKNGYDNRPAERFFPKMPAYTGMYGFKISVLKVGFYLKILYICV